jgi:hypothetical protein
MGRGEGRAPAERDHTSMGAGDPRGRGRRPGGGWRQEDEEEGGCGWRGVKKEKIGSGTKLEGQRPSGGWRLEDEEDGGCGWRG